jgi:pyrroloquinoline-quinone synthase
MRREILDNIIESKCLLKHPFYQAWNMGTLTTSDLGVYATQYGEFIDRIAAGWESVGDPDTAADFADGLDAPRPAQRRLPEIEALVSLSDELFRQKASALGALYAFEQQQPATAESKLAGLRRHYDLPDSAHAYFEIHQSDVEEPNWLAKQIEGLSPQNFDKAESACRRMAAALWGGLDGVMVEIGR